MTTLILLMATLCVTLGTLHLVSTLVAVVRIRNCECIVPAGLGGEGVSILRPVCGLENFSEETLGSGFRLDFPHYEMLFCVAEADDPVVPLLKRLIAANPHVPARLLVGNERISPNPKLNNLVKGWAAARHRWIVMADSNVLLRSDCIDALLAAWRPDTGLVCSPPIGDAPDGLWAELECAFLNTYQARWQYLAAALGIGFAQGKAMLWRRDLLEAVGGIGAIAAEAAEDAAATKLVRRAGLRVRLVNVPFAQPIGRRSAGEVWQRQLRWGRLRRHTFRLFFLPELLTGIVVPLTALVAVCAAAEWPIATAALAFTALWYGAEAVLAYAAGWQLSHRSPVVWLVRDLALPILWFSSWMGNGFVWRGHSIRIAPGGSSA